MLRPARAQAVPLVDVERSCQAAGRVRNTKLAEQVASK
jgi:hypothetical protein